MSNEYAPAASAAPKKIGVVVVHGVGETDLGYAVNSLAESLAKHVPGYEMVPHSEVIRLKDEEASGLEVGERDGKHPVFRVVRRRVNRADNVKIILEELHWSDVTNLQPGRFNALLGMFRVIFESHHLVNAMLDHSKDWATAILRRLLLVAGWLMRGPLAALTISTSAICAVLLFGPLTGTIGAMPTGAKFLAVQIALFLAALVLLVLVARSRDVSWYDTAFWLAIVTALLIILEWVVPLPDFIQASRWTSWIEWHCFDKVKVHGGELYQSLQSAYPGQGELHQVQANACYVNGPYRVIAYGWRLWGALLLASNGILLFMWSNARSDTERAALAPAATSIGIVILQFMLWTIVVVTAIFPMLNRAEAVSDLLAAKGALMGIHVDLTNPSIVKILQGPAIDLEWIGRFKFVYGAAAFTLVGFVAISALILLRRRWLAYRHDKDPEGLVGRMPALLFNGWLIGWLMLALFAVIAFIYYTRTPENELFDKVKSIMLLIAAGAALVSPTLLGERVSNGVHIARDLIDHYYDPTLETGRYFFPGQFGSKHRNPRRSRIQARLRAVVEGLGKEGPFDAVVLAGHSQGSIVVYDFLNEGAPGLEGLGGGRPSLITFGSPLGSFYRKYFFEYADLASSIAEFRARLSHWANIYRVDDYIGGRIVCPPGVELENVALPRGGHMGYWSEQSVAEAMDRAINRHLIRPDGPLATPRGRVIKAA